MPMRKQARFDHQAALADVTAGMNMQEVGDKYGVSRQRIQQIVKRAGFRAITSRDHIAEATAEVVDYVKLGLPDVQIAEELGLSVGRVASARRAAGLSERDRLGRCLELLKAHTAKGGSFLSFCKQHDLNRGMAWRLAKQAGIKALHGRHRDFSDRAKLVTAWRKDGLTWDVVAQRLGEHDGRSYTAGGLCNWAARHAPDLTRRGAAKARRVSRTQTDGASFAIGRSA